MNKFGQFKESGEDFFSESEFMMREPDKDRIPEKAVVRLGRFRMTPEVTFR